MARVSRALQGNAKGALFLLVRMFLDFGYCLGLFGSLFLVSVGQMCNYTLKCT